MQAPRLRVGIYADGDAPVDLTALMRMVGHTVSTISEPTEIREAELVVISVADDVLAATVELLATFARRGQMFLHTSLRHGIQIMDPLETSGAIVMAAHPIGADRWVTASPDELGETIVGLLVGEFGGSVLEVGDEHRGGLAAALSYSRFADTLRSDATGHLNEFLHDIEVAGDIVKEAGAEPLPDLGSLRWQYESVEDPGRRRLFRDLARRQAEITGRQDVELWAIQQEDR